MSQPPKRRHALGPILGVLVLLGIAGGTIYWLTSGGTTAPERIFVSVTSDHPAFARALRQRLGRQLASRGFVVASEEEGANDQTDLSWDDALAAAAAAGAHYLVHVGVHLDSERPGLTEGTTFAVATGEMRVGPVDAAEAAEAEPAETRSLTFGSEGRGDVDEALMELAGAFAVPMGHWAAGDLLSMPAMVDLLEHPERIADAERRETLSGALDKKAGQQRSQTRYDELCVEAVVQATLDDELGPVPVQCLDIDCGERYLFALSRDGTQALVHIESPTIFVPFANSPAPQTAETLERLELIPFDEDGERKTLAVAESFYGDGSMSADGSRVAFVEQARQRFGVVGLEVESGERHVLAMVERPGVVVRAVISPDGRWVAIEQKAFHQAHTELHVVPFEGGEEVVISRRTRMARWVVAPLSPGEEPRQLLAFDGTPTYDGSPLPALVDPASPEDVVTLDVGDYVVRQVIGANEGRLVLLGSPSENVDRCALGVRDPASGSFEWREIATCIGEATMTESFEVVGTAIVTREGDLGPEDAEVMIMNLDTGDTSIHTVDRVNETHALAAGRHIAFDRPIPSQFPAVHPHAVCWTTR